MISTAIKYQMPDISDISLLQDYSRHGSEECFAKLVQRHVNLVYSAALRQTGIPAHAEEITQAVFIILARKAGTLRPDTVLEAWLYQTTRLTSLSFLRDERRRRIREQEAYMQSTIQESNDVSTWNQIALMLDEAMARLGNKDREAVVLRFFKEKNLREVAIAMNVTEAAAQSRVHRALEKLRRYFSKRGVASTTAIIANEISAHSVHAAPAGLAKTISAIAAVKGATASTSTLTLIKGALKLMTWTKAKTAAVIGIGILLAAGSTAVVTVKEIQLHRTFPWQVRNADSRVFHKVPPQVAIAPARYPDTMGAGVVSMGDTYDDGQILGIAQPVKMILDSAYGIDPARTIISADIKLPQDKYDFIANLPSGNKIGLQNEIKKTFSLTGILETRDTDVLCLQTQSQGAAGLEPADLRRRNSREGFGSSRSEAGLFSCKNQPLSSLRRFLEGRFKVPVLDQTGLTNRFDIDLKWDETDYQHPNLDNLKTALLDQLGLELVPANMPVEMLVVQKTD